MSLNDEKMTGLTCFNLGKVYGAQNNWKMAQIMFRQSAAITKKLPDQKGCRWSLFYLGDTCNRLGDKDTCRKYWQEALKLFNEVSPDDAGSVKKALDTLG